MSLRQKQQAVFCLFHLEYWFSSPLTSEFFPFFLLCIFPSIPPHKIQTHPKQTQPVLLIAHGCVPTAAARQWVHSRLPLPLSITRCSHPVWRHGAGTALVPCPARFVWGRSSWSTRPRPALKALWRWRCQDWRCCMCSSILPCSSIRRATSWIPCRGRSLPSALISPGNLPATSIASTEHPLICVSVSTSALSLSVAPSAGWSWGSTYISPSQGQCMTSQELSLHCVCVKHQNIVSACPCVWYCIQQGVKGYFWRIHLQWMDFLWEGFYPNSCFFFFSPKPKWLLFAAGCCYMCLYVVICGLVCLAGPWLCVRSLISRWNRSCVFPSLSGKAYGFGVAQVGGRCAENTSNWGRALQRCLGAGPVDLMVP